MTTNKKAAPARAAQNTTAAANCTEVITVIKSRSSLAPRYLADGSVWSMDKSGAAVIEVREVPVRNLDELNDLLEQLRTDPNSAIVPGRYIGDDKVKRKEDGSFTSFDAFVDRPSHLVTFRAYAARVQGPDDLEEKIGLFRKTMPEIFHGKPFVWRLRVKGKTDRRPKDMHQIYLTFWMDDPMTLAQVRTLCKKERPVPSPDDRVLFPSTIIPTSDPVFKDCPVDATMNRRGYFQESEPIGAVIATGKAGRPVVADKITILETLGPKLTKMYVRHEGVDGTVPYEDAASFKVSTFEATSLRDVADRLGKMHKNVKKCFIRGRFVGEDKAQPGYSPGTWARNNANFDDQPLHWFMVDIDGFIPSWSHPVETVASSVMEYIDRVLPPCFKGASFYWHLSSSAGMPGKEDFLKCHVHFWSKTPYTSAQMYAWAKTIGPMIDSAVYRRTQVHYTADPVFEDGRVDPVKVRAGWHQGEHDEVDLVIGEETLEKAHAAGSGTGGNDMKLKDPSEKDGLIGLFHKTFDAEDVLLTLLDEFEQVSQRRYTWLEGGGTPEGVWVHDDGMHIGSSHNTWPFDGIANLWDVVRVFKFGDKDHHADAFEQLNIDAAPVGSRPSDRAMYEWAEGLPEIKEVRAAEKTTKLGDMVLAQIADILHRSNDKDELAKELKFDSEKISRVLAAMAFNPLNSKFWLMTPDFGGVISTEKDLPLMVGEHYGGFMSNVRAAVERSADTLRFDGEGDRKAWVKETTAKVLESPIKALITKTKAFRQFSKVDLVVDMFATTGSMRVRDGIMVLLYTHPPFAVGTINQAVVSDYRDHFPEFDDFIDLLTASRFASSRKKSHVWLNCDSDWGKSFLMSALAKLGLVVETSVGELEKMLAGGPVGKTIDEFKRVWCLAIDEFKGVKSEVKQLSEYINFAPKGLPTVQAPLYLKLFMSAEAVDSLASEDSGIEDQFANRFLYIDGKGSIEDRSLFANSKGSYMSSLVSYLGQRLNERVDYFRSLGGEGAADAADNELVALYEKYRIDRKFKRLSVAIPDLARRFAEDCASAYSCPLYQRTRFQREAAPHVVETPSHGLCLKCPAPVLKLWITETFGQSEGGKLSYKRQNIMKALGGSKPIRDFGNEWVRAVVLGVPMPAAGPERDFSD